MTSLLRCTSIAGWTPLRRSLTSAASQQTILVSWGEGSAGQLGHAEIPKSSLFGWTGLASSYVKVEPKRIPQGSQLRQICVGETFSIGVTYEGKLMVWGKNIPGFKDDKQFNVPFELPLSMTFDVIACGPRHVAALGRDRSVYTWGHNGHNLTGGGMLGHGHYDAVAAPKLVDFLATQGVNIVDVSCGAKHTVFLTQDKELLVCGAGEYGRLGTGDTHDELLPKPVELEDNVEIAQVSCGYDHSLALSTDGRIYSWGRNNMGQLGHNDSYIDIYSLEALPRLIDDESFQEPHLQFAAICAGNGRSAAITRDGKLYFWGNRFSHAPKLIPLEVAVKKVVIGGDASRSGLLILTTDHQLLTFGDESSQLLAKGGNASTPKPVPKLQSHKVLDIFAGFGHHAFAVVERKLV